MCKGDEATKVGPIETKTLDEVPKEPYPLHPAFEWYEFDVNSDEEMQQIFELLEQNYVEDDEAMFRFAYPIEFLRWYILNIIKTYLKGIDTTKLA